MPNYLTTFGITLGAWLLFEVWLFLRDRSSPRPEAAADARRGFIVLALAVAFAMNVPGLTPAFDLRRGFAIWFAVGIALAWAAMLLRFWAARLSSPAQEGTQLITSGPYRFVRHPSYAGGLVALLGLGLAIGNIVSLALLLLAGLAVYVSRTRRQERFLTGAFGSDYESYRSRTWALIPFVW